jgi:hypothetical protein
MHLQAHIDLQLELRRAEEHCVVEEQLLGEDTYVAKHDRGKHVRRHEVPVLAGIVATREKKK